MKGSYVLIIEVKKDQKMTIGKLGTQFFKKGYYAYVGSAMNSLENRINRHICKNKKIHWHIDYLTSQLKILKIFYLENDYKEECDIANNFGKKFKSIAGFGCTDCKCKSHLFFGELNDLVTICNNLKLKQYFFKIF